MSCAWSEHSSQSGYLGLLTVWSQMCRSRSLGAAGSPWGDMQMLHNTADLYLSLVVCLHLLCIWSLSLRGLRENKRKLVLKEHAHTAASARKDHFPTRLQEWYQPMTPKGLRILQPDAQKHVSDLQPTCTLLNLYILCLKQAKANGNLQFFYCNSLKRRIKHFLYCKQVILFNPIILFNSISHSNKE